MVTRRNAILAVIAAGLAAAAGLYVRDQQLKAQAANEAAIRQAVVGVGTIVATVNATGNLAPREQTRLFFRTTGQQPVIEVTAALGDSVRAGEVLARLDDRDLRLAVLSAEHDLEAARLRLRSLNEPARPEDIAVAEARAAVARNRVYAASLGQPAEAVEIARLNLVLAQEALNATYAEMDRLVEQGRWGEKNALQATADRQVEEARIADERYHQAQRNPAYGPIAAAQAELEDAEATLERLLRGPSDDDRRIAELEVSQAQSALESAGYELAGAVIVAPYDGVVVEVNLREGEAASLTAPALVVADTSRFYLDVSVDEVDIALVAPGQPVTVTVDALPNLLMRATVDRIAPSATLSAAGVVGYAVRLALEPTDAPLRGGMTATAAVVVDEARDVVVVPNWAIRRDRNSGEVYAGVLRDGEVVDVPVRLGLRDEAVSQVLDGLAAGDVVAARTARVQFSLFGGGE